MGLRREPLHQAFPMWTLDRHRLGMVAHHTISIRMRLTSKYMESIRFHILDQHSALLVLGFPLARPT